MPNKPSYVMVLEDSTTIQREAVTKLFALQETAVALRRAMDYCADHSRLEDMLANNMHIEATLAYARRAQCSIMDAREYIARVLAEQPVPIVSLHTAANDTTH
jgi:hypothetical protein